MIFHRSESFRQYVFSYPATSSFIFLSFLMFLIATFSGGSTNPYTLLKLGAFYPQLPIETEWYRFVSSLFLHIGFEHLLFNAVALYLMAPFLEKTWGSCRFCLFSLAAGIAGNGLTFFFEPHTISAGASGMIFGILAAYVSFVIGRVVYLDSISQKVIVVFFGINLVSTFLMPHTSITGHLGGMFFGFFIGFLYSIKKRGK